MENLTLVIPAKEEKESLPKVLQEIEKFKCKKKSFYQEMIKKQLKQQKNLKI